MSESQQPGSGETVWRAGDPWWEREGRVFVNPERDSRFDLDDEVGVSDLFALVANQDAALRTLRERRKADHTAAEQLAAAGQEVTWRFVYPHHLAHDETDKQVYEAAWLANSMEQLLAAERRANAKAEQQLAEAKRALEEIAEWLGPSSSGWAHKAVKMARAALARIADARAGGAKVSEYEGWQPSAVHALLDNIKRLNAALATERDQLAEAKRALEAIAALDADPPWQAASEALAALEPTPDS